MATVSSMKCSRTACELRRAMRAVFVDESVGAAFSSLHHKPSEACQHDEALALRQAEL